MNTKKKNRIGMFLAYMGGSPIFLLISSYLVYYYTNVAGLDPAAVGTVLLVSRVLDGVSDVVFGNMIDRTRTKMGVCRNVNRLIDTKEMNRISGKPLKTRDSGTLAVAGIPCLLFGWFENLRRSAEGVFTFEPSPKGI